MGLFTKKSKGTPCPICGEQLDGGVMIHNLDHATPDGAGGFRWECTCGERAGTWEDPAGAAGALALHFNERHGIDPYGS